MSARARGERPGTRSPGGPDKTLAPPWPRSTRGRTGAGRRSPGTRWAGAPGRREPEAPREGPLRAGAPLPPSTGAGVHREGPVSGGNFGIFFGDYLISATFKY